MRCSDDNPDTDVRNCDPIDVNSSEMSYNYLGEENEITPYKYDQQSIYTRISAAHAINTANQRFAYTAKTDGHNTKFSKVLCVINGTAAYIHTPKPTK